MRIRNWVLLLLAISLQGMAQKHTISGYVMDAQSKETLIGATIFDTQSNKGCATNSYGFYTLTLPDETVNLQVAFVGYEPQNHTFILKSDTTLSFLLQTNNELEEVVIEATRTTVNAQNPQMGIVELPIKQIKTIPSLFGETDVLKAIQLLPGVQNGTEGSAGMYVRGGGPDENLILLDGVPVYNANHALGFFSVFNADAIKNVTLYKGSFPAHFGGRLSSVLDIRMKEGNMQAYHGNASIGLIASKANVEGPIVKDKLSFNFSARRTYGDLLIKPVLWIINHEDPYSKVNLGYNFYDVNAKLNWKISDRDRLYLSYYNGDDKLFFGSTTQRDDQGISLKDETRLSWKWGNQVAALRWNHVLSKKTFMDATLHYTQYRHTLGVNMFEQFDDASGSSMQQSNDVRFKSGIHDLTAKIDFDFTPNPNHEIRFGGNYTYHIFRPDVQVLLYEGSGQNLDTVLGSPDVFAHETALYVEDNMTLGDLFRVNLGAHYSTFTVQGKTYHSVQPRVSASLMLASNFSIKAGYAYMSQYVHLLSNSSLSLPTDLWVPVTANIEPMKAHQWSIGGFYELPELFDISLEGYYKTMDNLIEYRDGASFLGSQDNWESKVCMGRGWAYGVELLLQRSFGKTTGWIGYTWSHSNRLFDRPGQEINEGKVFPAKYDRRHDISLTVQHKLNKYFDFSATWVFSSGNWGSLGTQEYPSLDQPLFFIDAVERNNYQMPNYHRLDLSMNYYQYYDQGQTGCLNISVYNAYNHKNPFLIMTDSEWDGNSERKRLVQVTLFPLIPSISYSYQF